MLILLFLAAISPMIFSRHHLYQIPEILKYVIDEIIRKIDIRAHSIWIDIKSGEEVHRFNNCY